MKKIIDYWAMTENPIRQSQTDALEFIQDAINKGKEFLVLDAPTGSGKSGIGITLSNWAVDQPSVALFKTVKGESVYTLPGSYYITPQNLLQDQLINEAKNGVFKGRFGDIRSSSHYNCLQCNGNCSIGSTIGCIYKEEGGCTYEKKKSIFLNADTSITNSAYLLHEFFHAHRLPPKQLLIVDEAHRLEGELASVHELNVHIVAEQVKTELVQFGGNNRAFAMWMKRYYFPYLNKQVKALEKIVNSYTGNWLEAATKQVNLKRKIQSLGRIIDEIENNTGRFIQYEDKFSEKSATYIIKPLQVATYAVPFFEKKAKYKLFMSASIENLKNFSAYTGIPQDKIAYCRIPSSFPVKHRPIYFMPIGSMNYKEQPTTLPKMLEAVIDILNEYEDKKGIIHCHSYTLGQLLFDALEKTKHKNRLLYSPRAEDRELLYNQHIQTDKPTVILGPSFTEGFDFKNELGRFQIIVKVPYALSSDPYIKAKTKDSWPWYNGEAVKTLIQATGRIVRHEQDFGDTFILDADLESLIKKNSYMFPNWWLESIRVIK